MKLSVVMPAQNEEGSVGATVEGVVDALEREEIDYEVIVVDDDSEDPTEAVVEAIGARQPARSRASAPTYERASGSRSGPASTSSPATRSRSSWPTPPTTPRTWSATTGCSRRAGTAPSAPASCRGAKVHDYPRLKLIVNRLANRFIRILFRHRYNDTTNAFKAYRREVIETIQPLLSKHFNLTVEMPLKAIVRGHTYAVIPTSWTNRTSGESKLAMKEMGSRYLFIVLYVWLETTLSRGDYRKREAGAPDRGDEAAAGSTPKPEPGHGVYAHQSIATLTQDPREPAKATFPELPRWLNSSLYRLGSPLLDGRRWARGRRAQSSPLQAGLTCSSR